MFKSCRVLFAAELEFLNILVPRLPQNSPNGNSYRPAKSKQPYFHVTSFLEHWLSSFFYSDINLFLIDYACCKLCNIWLLLFGNNTRNFHHAGASHWRKNIVAVIKQVRVIDDHLKRLIKKRTLYTWKLFLLTRIFQYISHWSKLSEHSPTLFLQYK